MAYIDAFINSLKEWDEVTSDQKDTRLDELVSVLLLQLGSYSFKDKDYRSNSLQKLKERLDYLVENERIFEHILTYGLISLTTNYFEDAIYKRYNHIESNEHLYEQAKDKFGEDNTSKGFLEIAERLKSKEYGINIENELDVWNQVVAKNFSRGNKRKLENEFQDALYKKVKGVATEGLDRTFKDLV